MDRSTAIVTVAIDNPSRGHITGPPFTKRSNTNAIASVGDRPSMGGRGKVQNNGLD
ncbi:MAG: hypothetical protein Fur0042_03400 [Cyanophyceae cyanobacterium]